jgi:hypothetical protein
VSVFIFPFVVQCNHDGAQGIADLEVRRKNCLGMQPVGHLGKQMTGGCADTNDGDFELEAAGNKRGILV